MRFLHAVTASFLLFGAAATAAAQPGAVYVNRGKVDAALAKGGALFGFGIGNIYAGHVHILLYKHPSRIMRLGYV